ncbi:hypothetical protein LEP1GSC047_1662 [Leptospira inadai serovar Lyme str. 10]|uniref:Uncharacterized protein n=2 Tax=Leptospira inadai serovar Lyme TaxID=293084 RepID=V6HAU9_9LEPT|nr:hypothetical protein [Leptospira inadai]EQA35603.1 hypothetical protein LEP1GSC047_1662 [Leptospira inadai serovar Lyme str. 10]PNV72589.1 hypothetical protein BES34_019100 [Leptospira inadai serovar Lyme]
MNHSCSHRFRKGRIFAWILFIPLFFLAAAAVVWQLWNWLLPELFAWKQITYWQALGIFVLSHLLFKGGHGLGGGRHKRYWKHRMKRRMQQSMHNQHKTAREE